MEYRSLVFVYHTDANPRSLVAEFVREHFSDGAYECSLCHLTYRGVLKRPEWTRYLKRLALPATFHLRSRFLKRHPELAAVTYPAVFIKDADGGLHTFLGADELRACATVEDLMVAIDQRLGERLTPPQSTAE